VEKLEQDVPLRVASANVHSKVFDDEVVVLEMKSGTYFSLRGAGVDIWQLVERNATAARIHDALEQRYDAPRAEIAEAVTALLNDLVEGRLIVADPSVEPAEAPEEVAEKAPFSAPQIERFTDMQELLLLDPIHEVDDTGWPHTPVTR
jgi:hypothetical protein